MFTINYEFIYLLFIYFISIGELITTNYTNTLWGTLKRRLHLKRVKNFDCTCKRCKDPTEFGMYIGAGNCPKCFNGTNDVMPKVISTDPMNNEAMWKCEKCEYTEDVNTYTQKLAIIKHDIDVSKKEPLEIVRFLDSFNSNTNVHPYLTPTLELKYALVDLIGGFDKHRLIGM